MEIEGALKEAKDILENKRRLLKKYPDKFSLMLDVRQWSHRVGEFEIEQSTPEYLIAYAYRERYGISIPDCIVLLSDYRRLQKINVVE